MHGIAVATELGFKNSLARLCPFYDRGINGVTSCLQKVRVRQDSVVDGFGNHYLHVRHNIPLICSVTVHCQSFPVETVYPLEDCAPRIILDCSIDNRS